MRIIKLSPNDEEFRTESGVHTYFRNTLPNRTPPGMFLLTPHAFGPNGISQGEKLIFTYKGRCVYKARAGSKRKENGGRDSDKYPYYFLVSVPSLEAIQGNLSEIQHKLEQARDELEQAGLRIPDLVKSRSWPKLPDDGRIAQMIDLFVSAAHDNTTHDTSPPPTPLATDLADAPPDRVKTTTYRILHDTELARSVKVMHEYRCQICGHTIELPDGRRYAEAHHIQPLGDPHKGLDVIGNILCVCPNHHAELDYRTSALTLSTLRAVPGHSVSQKYVDYHNSLLQGNDDA